MTSSTDHPCSLLAKQATTYNLHCEQAASPLAAQATTCTVGRLQPAHQAGYNLNGEQAMYNLHNEQAAACLPSGLQPAR